MQEEKLSLYPQRCMHEVHEDFNQSVRESNLQEHARSSARTHNEFLLLCEQRICQIPIAAGQ